MATSALSDDGDHGFQIAPMVDVVFVLLLFFMALAGANQLERHLNAPLTGHDGNPIIPPLFLDLAANGTVSINGLVVVPPADKDTAGLDQWMARYRDAITDDTPFIIRPQNDARHGRVIGVLNSIQKAGYKTVAFQ